MSIENHKWLDKDITGTLTTDTTLELDFNEDVLSILLNKEDATAIAKHFGIIGN